MDPTDTLRMAMDALAEGDTETANECLENYLNWRRKSGFEPHIMVYGDVLATALREAITSQGE